MPPVPLLDHFHPPLSRTHPWRAFHGTWAAATARLLNAGGLPPGYYAVPFLDRDGPVEVDPPAVIDGHSSWEPGPPGGVVEVEWPPCDGARVEVRSDEGDRWPVAVIDFPGERSKDRGWPRGAAAQRRAVVLSHGFGLVLVDVVTTRQADLHADLVVVLGQEPPDDVRLGLMAWSYRPVPDRLQAWPSPLELGRPLPTVPLWLAADLSVKLDLDAGYTAACADLSIRPGERPA